MSALQNAISIILADNFQIGMLVFQITGAALCLFIVLASSRKTNGSRHS